MKILIVHNRYQSNNIGGEDIVYDNELKSLRELHGEDNVLAYQISNDDISKFSLLFGIWFSRKHYRNIKKIVRDNNIDIVHVHNFFPLLTPSVFKAAKKSGAKVVHTLHNYRLWCISGILYRDGFGICELCTKSKLPIFGIKNKCYRKSRLQSLVAQAAFSFYKLFKMFKNIDYYFVLTDFQRQKVRELGIPSHKIILKPNSISLAVDQHIQKNKQNYIYVGRLEESKGIFELLDIWVSLDDKFVLTMVGDSPDSDKIINKYSSKNIIFKGKCTREETLSLISQSKYLIQPSVWYETFGLTIIEAMSFGVPVIGFDIGTRRDFIKNRENGFITTKNDLQTTIQNSYDYSNYELMSQNAKNTAKQYQNDYIIAKQLEIYKNILEG
ncbi:glycosyltransferase [Francisella philomiragia]|uniref:Glycosyl transferase, group 1 n=1 Tax=Francisella philomiragia subsp. philomiragia (strain ATCC 25017 / CCUG 19701 / FSC 153 / O\|nr:glycosyltransferase family 4 protein [Francisella philomiragia]AJI48059.1 glycosyl transferases group 1 family protein [Francisella philomiragia]AJI49014.1 glycosyl transferases group 1 family protein [Francisella philomiragia]MBK2020732.1 glycosyltransferase [Francisella philomiragia]MBK2030848.1 glycosyltransferase [Francisella philomiragia]MBK2263494.1 glycosyltransferase [Francisella philomiragia]